MRAAGVYGLTVSIERHNVSMNGSDTMDGRLWSYVARTLDDGTVDMERENAWLERNTMHSPFILHF